MATTEQEEPGAISIEDAASGVGSQSDAGAMSIEDAARGVSMPPPPKSLRSVSDSVADADPKTAAKIISIVNKTGQHPAFVAENMSMFDRMNATMSGQELDDVERKYPNTAAHLSDPKVMAVAKNDIGSLTAMEKLSQAYNSVRDSIANDLNTADLEIQKSRLWAGDVMGEDNKALIDAINKTISEQGKVFGKEEKESGLVKGAISGAIRLGQPMAESAATGAAFSLATLPVFPPAVPVAFAVGEAAYWFNYMTAQANEQLAAIVDKKGNPLPPEQRRAMAIGIGAVSSVPAAMGFRSMMKTNPAIAAIYPQLKKEIGESVLESPGWKDAIIGYVKKHVKSGVHFGATMASLTGIQKEGESLAKSISGQPFDFESGGEILKQMGESFKSGFGVGAVMAAPGAAWELGKDAVQLKAQERRAELSKNYVESVAKVALNSEYRELDPNGFANSLNRNQGPIFIPKESFDAYFQGKNIDPKQAAAELGINASYELAILHNDNVSVPFGTFNSKIMDAHRPSLMNDIKLDINDRTRNQDKVFKQEKVEQAKASQDKIVKESEAAIKENPEVQADFEYVRDDIKTKLLADPDLLLKTGKTIMSDADAKAFVEDQADIFAKLQMGGARATGLSIREWYEGGPEIRAGKEGQAGALGQKLPTLSNLKIDGPEMAGPGKITVSSGQGKINLRFDDSGVHVVYAEVPKEMQGKGFGQALIIEALKQAEKMGRPLRITSELSPKIQKTFESMRKNGQIETIGDAEKGGMEIRRGKKDILKQESIAPTFYSKLQKDIEARLPEKATVEQVQALLRDQKEDERKWSGIDEFLKGKTKISKPELLEFLKANKLEVSEVEHGGEAGNARVANARAKINDLELLFKERGYDLAHADSEHIGDLDIFKGDEKIERSDLPEDLRSLTSEYADAHRVVADDFESGDSTGGTKYADYQLPGGENYRELLLTMPGQNPKVQGQIDALSQSISKIESSAAVYPIGSEKHRAAMAEAEKLMDERDKLAEKPMQSEFQSSHFDESNILAHVRFNDRVDADGKKVLFVEEVQSDWHQKGRREGYQDPEAKKKNSELSKERDQMRAKLDVLLEERANRTQEIRKEVKSKPAGDVTELPDGTIVRERAASVRRPDAIWEVIGEGNSGPYTVGKTREEAVAHALDILNQDRRSFGAEGIAIDDDKKLKDLRAQSQELTDKIAAIDDTIRKSKTGVPDAPFKKTWHEFALKRMIRYAAENGYDKLGWTTGEQQAERYDLSKQVDAVHYRKDGDSFYVHATGKDGRSIPIGDHPAARLPDVVGKDIADKIIAGEGKPGELTDEKVAAIHGLSPVMWERSTDGQREAYRKSAETQIGASPEFDPLTKTLSGVDLKVGGEGMKGFYDKIVPAFLNKFGKKFGAEVGDANVGITHKHVFSDFKEWASKVVPGQDEGYYLDQWQGKTDIYKSYVKSAQSSSIHALPITPEMKRAALNEGFPMFQGEGSDPRGQYTPSQRLIDLFKGKADPSSLLHESSHDWLEQFHKHINSGRATEAGLAEYKIVSDFLNIKADQGKLTEEQHEKFADAWEEYIAEGKAPSVALKGVFQRMAERFAEIYKNIKESLGGKLDDPMRGFFDRMLATKEEIEAARREVGMDPQPKVEGVDPATELKHKTLEDEARRQAEEILMKPQMEEMKAANKEAIQKERERLTQQIENQVVQEPLFKALSLLDLGRKKSDYWFHANDYINDKLSEEDAQNFEDVAEMSGFSSADELAKQILLNDPKEALKVEVKKRVDEEMKKFSDLKDTTAMREEALKAVHSDKFLELLALEQQIFTDLQKNKDARQETTERNKQDHKILLDAAKDQAKAKLWNMPIKEAISFRQFFTAQRNAAARASKAAAKGDTAAAARAKGDQLNAGALAAESLRLRDRVGRWTEYLSQEQSADPKTYKSEEHFFQAADVLRRFGFDRKDYIGNKRKESLTQWIERNEEKTNVVSIPDWIQNESIKKDYKDLTPAELKDVRDTVKNIKHVANFEDKAYTVFDKADLNDVAAILLKQQQQDAANNKGAPLSLSQDWRDKLIAQKDAAMFQLISTETWLRKLDGYKNFGPWWKAFYEHYARGADEKAKMLVESAETYSKIWDEYTPKEREAMNKKIFIPEFNDSLMKTEIMTMALNFGSESNMERLLEGRGWKEEQVRSILDREMTKRDWDTVQKTWNHIDSFWPQIAELYKELTGFTPEKIERKKFMTQFGEYEGGYFPLRSDPRVEVRGAQQVDVDASLSDSPPAWRASTKNGFSKGRVKGAQYKVSLDINGIQRHITDVVHDLTLRKWVLDANRLLMRKDIQASVSDAIGMDGYKMMNDWVKAVAGTNDFQSREYLGDFFHGLRRRTIIANLGLRVGSMVLQVDDMSAYGRVDPDNFGVMNAVQATVGFYGRILTDPAHYKQGVDFVLSKSKYMKYERGENLDRDIKEAGSRTWGEKDSMGKVAMSMVTTVDHMLSIPVWIEAYKKGMELNDGHEQKAVDYADNIIRRAQSSGRMGELPAIMRGSEKQKALTMFYSFVSKRLNLWYEALDKTKFNEPKDLQRLAGTVMALWIVPTLFSSFVHNGVPNTKDKRKRYMKDMLLYPTSLFPVIRDVADFAMDKAMGLPSFGYSVSPLTRSVEAVGNLIGTLAPKKSGAKSSTQDKIEAAAKVASYAAPYPDSVNAVIFNVADYMHNGMKPIPSDVLRRRPKKDRRK